MSIRVILEPKIDAHDPHLYRSEVDPAGVDGWSNLDPIQIQNYFDRGYLWVRGGCSDAEVAAAKNEIGAMSTSDDPQCEAVYYEGNLRDHLQEDPERRKVDSNGARLETLALGETMDRLPDAPQEIRARSIRKFMSFVENHPPLAALARRKEILDAVKAITGESVRLFQDMAMIKPPQGREKPWHQDHAYFNYPLEVRIVGVWIPLDEANLENGCMHVIPGGHKNGPRPHFMRRDWQICDADLETVRQTAIPMGAGDVLIFDSKLPHGTPTNKTTRPRWAVQFHYIAASAVEGDDSIRLAAFGSEGKGVTC